MNHSSFPASELPRLISQPSTNLSAGLLAVCDNAPSPLSLSVSVSVLSVLADQWLPFVPGIRLATSKYLANMTATNGKMATAAPPRLCPLGTVRARERIDWRMIPNSSDNGKQAKARSSRLVRASMRGRQNGDCRSLSLSPSGPFSRSLR